MAELYQQLVEDHINISRVLNAFDKALRGYDENSQGSQLPLILDTLDYIQAYPETFHHPLEDKAFAYLETHCLGDADIIDEIKQQHQSLEAMTVSLTEQFHAIANDCVVPFAPLREECSHFLTAQRHHLQTENKHIFPVLAELGNEAWWDIASRLILNQDPLFRDDADRQQFRELAKDIIDEAAQVNGA